MNTLANALYDRLKGTLSDFLSEQPETTDHLLVGGAMTVAAIRVLADIIVNTRAVREQLEAGTLAADLPRMEREGLLLEEETRRAELLWRTIRHLEAAVADALRQPSPPRGGPHRGA